MPPKKAAAGPVHMCGARKCGSTNSNVPAGMPKVYKPAQCTRACAEGSNLCTLCQKQEVAYLGGKKGMWHGRFDAANIPPGSHMRESDWFAIAMAKLAAKEAKAAGASAAAVPAPEVKAAAKEAERAAKEAAAIQKRIATQAAAYEREQAAYLTEMGRMVNREMKEAAVAEKAAAKAAAAAARVTKKATSARKPAAAAARRSSSGRASGRRSSAAKRTPATIYVPASAAAAAARSDETLGSLALSSDNSSNIRWRAARSQPAGIPMPSVVGPRHENPMLPSVLYHGPRMTSSNRRSTQRHVSLASSNHRSTRRAGSRHIAAAAPVRRSSSSHAAAPARSSSSHSASRAAAPVVQTNGAGANAMIDMEALMQEMQDMGINTTLM